MTIPDFTTQAEVEQFHPFPGMISYPTGAQHAIIKLFERDRPESEVILPLTPKELPEQGKATSREYNVIGAGSHSSPSGRDPREWTLDGIFYGGPRAPMSQMHDWRAPQDLAAQIRSWLNRQSLLHLQAYSRAGPLDVACYVDSYKFTRTGWAGDIEYQIHLTEWRPLRITIDDGTDSSQSVAVADDEEAAGSGEETPAEPLPLTYTVVPGDSLWLIAKRMLGDTGRWPEIYDANTETIGTDPNLIYPGYELIIPGGHADADPDEPGPLSWTQSAPNFGRFL